MNFVACNLHQHYDDRTMTGDMSRFGGVGEWLFALAAVVFLSGVESCVELVLR